jgi:hypothetical protein
MRPEEFLDRLVSHDEVVPETGPGVYVHALRPGSELPRVRVAKGALYVGMTESSLAARSHFTHKHSGFSTLRRSLGAVLKEKLSLHAEPRAPGPSASNVRNYRFNEEGEQRLTEWMKAHLVYAHLPVGENQRVIESDMILALEPPMNLTGWKNPQAAWIKNVRAQCVEEARLHLPSLASRF